MKNILKYTLISALALALVIPSPILALAKDNDNDKGKSEKSEKSEKRELAQNKSSEKKSEKHRSESDDDDDKDENRVERSNDDKDDDKDERRAEKLKKNNLRYVGCVTKSFGHLIAPGWIKKHAQVTVSDDCSLAGFPPGIFWLYGYHSTSTPTTTPSNPDTVAPVISNIQASSTSSSKAVVSWTTDEKAYGTVWYSTQSSVNTNTASSTKGDFTKDHRVALKNLSADTTYYYIVRSKDRSGNTTTSGEKSFKTSTTTLAAPIISDRVVTVGTSTARVMWDTNIVADSTVFYGTSTPIDVNASTTAYTTNGTLTTDHDITVTGLATSTTYYLVIQSKNAVGTIKNSSQFSLTTSF